MKKLVTIIITWLFTTLNFSGLSTAQSGYWIAFQSNRDGSDDIFIMDANGNGIRNLTVNQAADRHPDWSPDGLQIAFASDRSGNNDIYVMSNNGEGLRNLTNHSANDNSPDWSSDGQRIAFISDRDGGQDVYSVDVTSLAITRLTFDGNRKSAPAWSPGDTALAYWEGSEGEEQIVIHVLETNEREFLTGGSPSSWPTWSPDGSQIAFFQTVAEAAEIQVIELPNRAITNLTNHAAADVRPAYSSDGQIAFASNRDGNFEIYTMNGDGSFPRRITFADGAEDTSPAWQPIPAAILPTEASAVAVLNGLMLSANSSMSGNRMTDEGQGRLFAPTSPIGLNDLIVIRLEIDPTGLNNDSQPPGTTTPPPVRQEDVDIYEILGAELTGVDLERFRVEPFPTDYVLRLDLNEVNYWEWSLRARDLNTLGTNYLGVRVYAPLVQADGTIAERDVFNHRFTIEVIDVASLSTTAETASQQYAIETEEVSADDGNGVFAVALGEDDSLTLIALGSADLSELTLVGAGYPYGEFEVLTDFPALDSLGWQRGVCVTYLREGASYRPPRLCATNRLFEYRLNDFDVFWYDESTNLPRDIVIRFAERTFVCTSTRSSCEFP